MRASCTGQGDVSKKRHNIKSGGLLIPAKGTAPSLSRVLKSETARGKNEGDHQRGPVSVYISSMAKDIQCQIHGCQSSKGSSCQASTKKDPEAAKGWASRVGTVAGLADLQEKLTRPSFSLAGLHPQASPISGQEATWICSKVQSFSDHSGPHILIVKLRQ